MIPTSTTPITTQSGTPVPAARIYQPQFTQPSPGNTAKVLFLRDAGSLGSACAHEILVDGEKIFAVRAGEYQALFLAPGQHSFVVEIAGGLCATFSKEHSTVLRDGAEETYRIFTPSLTSEPSVEIVSTSGADGPPMPSTTLEDVPGTLADAQLQRDIRSHLWKIERDAHDEECEFDVVKAQPYGVDDLSKIGKADPEGERLDRRLRKEGKVHVEKWTVLSCGTPKDYEVILMKSPGGGTEISAAPIEPASSAETTELDKGLAAHRRGDYDTAFRELLPLAEQGMAEAQHGVGVMYSDGQGVAADPSEAVKWFRRAAEQGLADAQLSLANMYFLGRQVPGDPAEAVKWYRRAAEQGHPQAQFSLASMYSVGTGVTQDYVLAYMWCSVSDAGSGVRRCDRVADKMTEEQIVRAKELASKFVPRQERSARPPSGTGP